LKTFFTTNYLGKLFLKKWLSFFSF
jgi:hypothetical protein